MFSDDNIFAGQTEKQFSDKYLFGSTVHPEYHLGGGNLYQNRLRCSYYYAPPLNYNSRVRIMSKIDGNEMQDEKQKQQSLKLVHQQIEQQSSYRNQKQKLAIHKQQKAGRISPQKEPRLNEQTSSVLSLMNRKLSNPNYLKIKIVKQPNLKETFVSQTQRLNVKGIQTPSQQHVSPEQKFRESSVLDRRSSNERQLTKEKSKQQTREGQVQSTYEKINTGDNSDTKLQKYLDEYKIVKSTKQNNILPKIQLKQLVVPPKMPQQSYQHAPQKQIKNQNHDLDGLSLSGWSDNSFQF